MTQVNVQRRRNKSLTEKSRYLFLQKKKWQFLGNGTNSFVFISQFNSSILMGEIDSNQTIWQIDVREQGQNCLHADNSKLFVQSNRFQLDIRKLTDGSILGQFNLSTPGKILALSDGFYQFGNNKVVHNSFFEENQLKWWENKVEQKANKLENSNQVVVQNWEENEM